MYSGSGFTCFISGFVMFFVVFLFVFGGLMYVEVCRELVYDDTKGKNLKVKLIYYDVKR